jgi:hypothetical protein
LVGVVGGAFFEFGFDGDEDAEQAAEAFDVGGDGAE